MRVDELIANINVVEGINLVNLDQETADLKKNDVGIYINLQPSELLDVILNNEIEHLIYAGDPLFNDHLSMARQMILNPSMFIDDSLDGIEEIMTGELNCYFSRKFNSAKEKIICIEELCKHLKKIQSVSRIQNNIQLVADELITNVLYNGPSSSKERPKIVPITRKKEISIDDKFGIIFSFIKGERVFVGAKDQFGSLPIRQTLEKLKKTFSSGIGESLNPGVGGAGVGLRLSYDMSVSMTFIVDKWNMTTVMFSLPMKRDKTVENLPKSIHLINIT